MEALEDWVRRVVVGLDLCPFAAAPLDAGRVRFCEVDTADFDTAVLAAVEECSVLVQTPASELSTTLIALPGWADFEEFLEISGAVSDFLGMAEIADLLQVVAFHPQWRAAGADPDDPANGTNRSPVPALHLLRQEEIERAVRGHPDVMGIVERNADLLRRRAEGD